MGMGYLKLEVFTGNEALPVGQARVAVKSNDGRILYELRTDANGATDTVQMAAPNKENSLDPYSQGEPYSTCDVEVSADGFDTTIIRGVQIFDTETSILPINMIPLSAEVAQVVYVNEIVIPKNTLQLPIERQQETSYVESRIAREVYIPDYIIVHLGKPNENAENVRVPFIDYIKNVASSEIYPTWPEASLIANIYCQISLALNRVYTEWYPSKIYPFQITNSTAYDQAFIYGRNIFENISNLVDRIFNRYIRRKGRKEPFFAEYCNGSTVKCPGLSQWGTVPLAQSGLPPIDILRYYYPKDIEIVECNVFKGIYESYPGTPLKEGDRGNNVLTIQNQLNRIRVNFPLIPEINNPNGVFGSDTTSAVKKFQKTFMLFDDGIVGRTTWYKISSIYTAVKKLAELKSEGEYIGIGAAPPIVVLREGSRGEDVVQLQFLLNFISEFYPGIPTVIENGVFDIRTKQSVMAFQKMFGLTQDGIVGPTTWQKLYEIYKGIEDNVNIPSVPSPVYPQYPGYPLRVGSSGNDVKLMQSYLNVISNRYPSIPKLKEDGIFGNGTKSAVIAFQNIFGLAPDGVIGPATWRQIVEQYNLISTLPEKPPYPGTALRLGSRGDNVALMQRYLNKLSEKYGSIPYLKPDGIFGSLTETAVKTYQRLAGLTPDGVIGPATWNSIVDQYNLLGYSVMSMPETKNNPYFKQAVNAMMLRKMMGKYRF